MEKVQHNIFLHSIQQKARVAEALGESEKSEKYIQRSIVAVGLGIVSVSLQMGWKDKWTT